MEVCEYGCGKEAKYQFKNGKLCCSRNHAGCSAMKEKSTLYMKSIFKEHPEKFICYEKRICRFCRKEIRKIQLIFHENRCYLNPKNLRLCPVCNEPIKYKSTTCSKKCAVIYFEDTMFKYSVKPSKKTKKSIESSYKYRNKCFKVHGKKCIVCGEENIVTVHHFSNECEDIKEEDLLPLCPTHHQYWHSKFRHLIEQQVNNYREDFINKKFSSARQL